MPEAVVIKPQDGPQTAALQCEADELLYGGGVFGGKTWELCIDALGLQYKHTLGKTAIEFPDYRGVMFRRKATEFEKLIEETQKYYRYYGGEFIYGRRGEPGPSWTFPSGARVFICHLQKEDNKFDHDSMEYQFLGFDQLEQFTLSQYLHLLGRGRTLIAGLFVRYRSTANPIGAGLKWVRARFVKDNEPYNVRYMLPSDKPDKNPAGIDITSKVLDRTATPQELRDMMSRCYIPASYRDNPLGMSKDPGYPGRVKAQGKKHALALLDNDWDAFTGDFFDDFSGKEEKDGGLRVQPFVIPERWRIVGSLDPGWTSACSFGLHAVDFTGRSYRIGTYYKAGAGMTENVEGIMAFIRANKYTGGRMPSLVVSGHDAWAKHDRLAIIGEELTFSQLFEKQGLTLEKAVTDRVNGWGVWKDMMRRKMWFYFDVDSNDAIVDEVLASEHDELNPNDIKGRGNDPEVSDHALDEQRYECMAVYKAPSPKQHTPKGPQDYQRDAGGKKNFGSMWKPGQG
jgi:hypothetical protein